MMIVAAQNDLASIGYLCSLLQQSPRQVERAAEVLGFGPAYRINGVAHFNGEQVEKLAAYFRKDESNG